MSDANVGADLPETAHFVGRVDERAELVDALTSGVNSIASVMGGRGMGKSFLLRQVERDLAAHAVKVVRVDFPGTAASFLARVGVGVGAEVTSENLEVALRAAVDREGRPLALLVDEIETLTQQHRPSVRDRTPACRGNQPPCVSLPAATALGRVAARDLTRPSG